MREPMDNNLLSSNLATGLTSLASSNPLGASPDATSGNSGTAVNTVKGADFANLFAQIMVDSTGQNLAADPVQVSADATASAGFLRGQAGVPLLPSGLTTIALSPQMQLVTAAKPLPDGSSLLAFARSQGLDESTVSNLFAEMSQKISTASVLGSSAPVVQSAPGGDQQSGAFVANLNALPTQIQTSSGLVPMPADMAQAMQALQVEMHWQLGTSGNTGPAMPTSVLPRSPLPNSLLPSSALPNSPLPGSPLSNLALPVATQVFQGAQGPQGPQGAQSSFGTELTLKDPQAPSTLSPAPLNSASPDTVVPLQVPSAVSVATSLPAAGQPAAFQPAAFQPEAKATVSLNGAWDRANLEGGSVSPTLTLLPTVPTLPTLPTLPMIAAALSPMTVSPMPLSPTPTSPAPMSPTPTSPAPMIGLQAALSDVKPKEARPADLLVAQPLGNVQPLLSDTQPNNSNLLNALRLQLQPVQAATQRLAAMASQNESASWGNLTGYTQGEGAVLDLSLAAPSQADPLLGKGSNASHTGDFNDTLSALASLGNTTSESGAAVSGLASTQSVNSNLATDPAKPSFTDQLATSQQNYQQMSEKLGQALASRLQDQIQSGQWKMQMNVVPAHLGKISIDLNMHSGGLDATFKSDNAATRDLIVAGMPTLRHNLNQSGTTVASVWVNADARGQSGGNPTPGQGRQTPPEAKKNPLNPEEESETSAGSSDEAGWSLMA